MVRVCEKFVPALAYLFCPALPGSCLARFAYFFADLSNFSPLRNFMLRMLNFRILMLFIPVAEAASLRRRKAIFLARMTTREGWNVKIGGAWVADSRNKVTYGKECANRASPWRFLLETFNYIWLPEVNFKNNLTKGSLKIKAANAI